MGIFNRLYNFISGIFYSNDTNNIAESNDTVVNNQEKPEVEIVHLANVSEDILENREKELETLFEEPKDIQEVEPVVEIHENVENKPRRTYGWKKDKVDPRDKIFVPKSFKRINQNPMIDLRNKCPSVYDQGQLGSCTANAIAAAYEYDEINQKEPNVFTPSRLFIYYNERSMEGTIDEDSGAMIRDGIKSINSVGVCHEDLWVYDISKFNVTPPDECYKDAENHKCVKYQRVIQTVYNMKATLIQGLPFVFGFTVYESFESEDVAKTGIMTMPTSNEKQLGGHAVMAVGYDDSKQAFIVRNSWGTGWGDNGYFYMPYDYISNSELASDFWVVQVVRDN